MPTGSFIALTIPTSQGDFVARYSQKGLAELRFPTQRTKLSGASEVPAQVRNWHRVTTRAVVAMIRGEQPGELPPLDLSSGSEFQNRVWSTLRKIALGKTRSYGEIAAAIGSPKAFRAVGSACGANPIPLLVPCHRVLAANRKIGGFSGGMDWKRKLLAVENVAVAN